LWVADMDFAVPTAVQRALAERAAHPIFGYTVYPESLYDALIGWLKTYQQWRVEREWIVLCPGVVPSLHAAILALSEAEEGVIVQPPVYAPFLAAPQITGRHLVLNPLKFEQGRYSFDLAHFEQCAMDGARFLLLCSPHNPVGRVWQVAELQALLDICQRHDITIMSDEIHADLVYPGVCHTPLAMLAQGKVRVITFDLLHISANNPFSIVAFEAAYRAGRPWLESLLDYLAATRDYVREFLRQHLPLIQLIAPEGTYLLWLDCRAMGLSDKQLKQFFVEEAGVGLSPGILFGAQGSGFMRMNIGAPRSVIAQALERIAQAERVRAAC